MAAAAAAGASASPHGNWSFPTSMVFGAGRVKELGDHVRAAGGSKALVVTDPGLAATPIIGVVTAALDAGDVPWTLWSGVRPNPVEADVFAGVKAYRQAGADCVIGVGGGSPLDAAKLVALMATHEPPLAQYDDAIGGDRHVTSAVPPILAVPTTAGTGSDVGRSGVVVLEETGLKTVIFSPYLLPRVALCDPELTVGLPPFLTAATGVDALTHCIEAYLAVGYHPFADGLALAGVEMVAEALPAVMADPGDLRARGQMMAAAAMGATAFQKGLGVCHSLAHPLSTVAGVHHGHANALMLSHVLTFNAEAAPERTARIAAAMGRDDGYASAAVAELVASLPMPGRLSDAGVGEDMLPELVRQAEADSCKASNPRPVTVADLEALYRAAM